MNKIAIICLAVGPLVAGCAGSMHSQGEERLAAADHQASSIAKLEKRVKSLGWRLSKVDKKLTTHRGGALDSDARAELQDVRQRLAQLESSSRSSRGSVTSGSTEASIPPDLAEKLTIINQKLARLSAAQRANEAQPSGSTNARTSNLARIVGDLAALRSKLAKLESSKGTGGSANLEQRLAKTEVALVDYIKKHDQLTKELERDRTLVVDYLEDLDSRIEELEKKSKTAAPGKQKP